MYNDIKNNETFTIIKPINIGWSEDKKYYVASIDEKKYLLRISDVSEYENKKMEFGNIKKLSESKINMSLPIEFGICNNGKNVYQLLTWCDRVEAKELLPSLSEKVQYDFGKKAGLILKRMEKYLYEKSL